MLGVPITRSTFVNASTATGCFTVTDHTPSIAVQPVSKKPIASAKITYRSFDMIFYHVTPRWNIKSIENTGLRPCFAVGKTQAVYLVTESNLRWAIEHTRKRFSTSHSNIVVITVVIPRRWALAGKIKPLRRLGRGFWMCMVDIPPDRLYPG